ncbi:uncharacterized protein LOC105702496 [Orussus abietinus]|uniref:uncharacterized protein LOC105702496 n=1 Tax=Orussus abietinus TaxID=222816 RepID=UPI000625BAA3|nr:uncharacterized protein LOC105702496 [Orussus abietinus]
MNVTEHQKTILLNFMKSHPDFGNGRMRYNSHNKRKMDEMWTNITQLLNTSGYGPKKSEKEWAKTWRDWKSNVLKKVLKRRHVAGIGGGSPLKLSLTSIENNLLEFLAPDVAGLTGVIEGGLGNVGPSPLRFSDFPMDKQWIENTPNSSKGVEISEQSEVLSNTANSTMKNKSYGGFLYEEKTTTSDKETFGRGDESPAHMEPLCDLKDGENIQSTSTPKNQITSKRLCVDEGENRNTTNKKRALMEVFNFQNKVLLLKKEKLALAREKLAFKKQSHKELMNQVKIMTSAIVSLQRTIEEMGPQYLEM